MALAKVGLLQLNACSTIQRHFCRMFLMSCRKEWIPARLEHMRHQSRSGNEHRAGGTDATAAAMLSLSYRQHPKG